MYDILMIISFVFVKRFFCARLASSVTFKVHTVLVFAIAARIAVVIITTIMFSSIYTFFVDGTCM